MLHTTSKIAITCTLAAGLFCARPARAEDPLPSTDRLKSSPVLRHLKPNTMPQPPRTPAEETVSKMYVPEGFRVELIAAEPDVRQPIAFAFDERGRIWIAEAYSYPAKRPAGQGLDRIIILEDTDGDGKFETRKIFTEGLNLISGFELGYGGVWVGAAPELLFIPDKNHDDKPDGPPQVLLDGFGFQDTHECLNSFMWGPDGWLYGNQGVFNTAHIGKPGAPSHQRTELRAGVWRYHPTRHEFEVFAHGGSNQWGLDYDEHGQIFMTHCRSYFGKGCTTHVIQGGHFWNQSNSNYAPFIIANPPADFPEFRNYLLASARYDHGAGGAGKPGSDAIYGGHSHVGTMIYQGDNWPDEFRGRLFTHNLGGHQINQQINNPVGSGFDTVHAGKDMFFCSDPKYVAVDLQYGPDGAVYIIDWYDQQHCHNPNTERWDRGNGRVYRMQWEATYKPVKVDLGAKTDLELVNLLSHKNAWYGRMAQRLLAERAGPNQPIDPKVKPVLIDIASNDPNPLNRLNALRALHAVRFFRTALMSDLVADRALADPDPYVRAWAIQIISESMQNGSVVTLSRITQLAKTDPSPIVRLYLASAIQREHETIAWELADALSQHAYDGTDRDLPLLLWQNMAPLITAKTIDRAFAIADKSSNPNLSDYTRWYAATLEGDALNRSFATLNVKDAKVLYRQLTGLWLAMEPRANLPMPDAWKTIAPTLYQHEDLRIRRHAERLAAVFGDDSMFPKLRTTLADTAAKPDDRKHAFAVLSRAVDKNSLPVFLKLLDEPAYRAPAINLLGRFDSPDIAPALLSRFEILSALERSAALSTLTSRPAFAVTLLDAVTAGKIKRDQLTAFHIRQLTSLKDAEVDKRVTSIWGKILQTPAEKLALINRLEKTFNEAPLWAYDGGAGKQHFIKNCATCHRIGADGVRIGPELTGAGKHGIRYFLENTIDPDAVIGADFQMTIIKTKSGDLLTGLLGSESASAVTLKTTTGDVVIAKTDIVKKTLSEKSMMPEGLIEGLPEREQIELLKFLVTH